jgi:hypothetical protein
MFLSFLKKISLIMKMIEVTKSRNCPLNIEALEEFNLTDEEKEEVKNNINHTVYNDVLGCIFNSTTNEVTYVRIKKE